MENTRKVAWKAIGRSYDGERVTNKEIVIRESDAITMDGVESFGVPINARLAIKLISNLWQCIKGKECEAGLDESNGSLQDRNKQMVANIKTQFENGNKDAVIDVINELQEKIAHADYWLDELLMNSFAITFDKSMLLKTLSQPECEGVRFYLCMKEDGYKLVPEQHGVLSLVTVGVDKFGKDLHFEYNPELHKTGAVEDASLTEEYGSSPHMLTFKLDDERLKPFVLFKYAMPCHWDGVKVYDKEESYLAD